MYSTPGLHFVNGRHWWTQCEQYSQTTRCMTRIWATQVRLVNGAYGNVNDWVFNNLTYLPYMTRAQWSHNPLGYTGEWTATDGRRWRTECDTPVSGGNGCRSQVYTQVVRQVTNPDGTREFRKQWEWVFNNIVRFK